METIPKTGEFYQHKKLGRVYIDRVHEGSKIVKISQYRYGRFEASIYQPLREFLLLAEKDKSIY